LRVGVGVGVVEVGRKGEVGLGLGLGEVGHPGTGKRQVSSLRICGRSRGLDGVEGVGSGVRLHPDSHPDPDPGQDQDPVGVDIDAVEDYSTMHEGSGNHPAAAAAAVEQEPGKAKTEPPPPRASDAYHSSPSP
jgi:hypothetical protein